MLLLGSARALELMLIGAYAAQTTCHNMHRLCSSYGDTDTVRAVFCRPHQAVCTHHAGTRVGML